MRFYFSTRVNTWCAILIAFTLSMAYWQWNRHKQKLVLLETFNKRLERSIVPIDEALAEVKDNFSELIFRRVRISGAYDFDHEIVLRNRRYKGIPGVFVLTPVKLVNSENYILVNRGFIPLKSSTREARTVYRGETNIDATVLVKKTDEKKLLAPSDPDPNGEWIDAWLRVDVAKIQKQTPYKLLPLYLEIMDEESVEDTKKRVVHSDAGQDELLTLAGREAIINPDLSKMKFPIPMYSTIVPAGRHLGYVYQWSAMAIMVLVAGFILQLRPPRR